MPRLISIMDGKKRDAQIEVESPSKREGYRWVDPTGTNQISVFLIRATEPILAPVRRLLPQTGMIDWSGFVVLIVLGVLWRVF